MKRAVSNQKGQFVIETVLMMLITVGLFLFGMNQLREGKFLAKLISGPWQKVAGMIEAGVWEEPSTARQMHPGQHDRSLSLSPKDYQ